MSRIVVSREVETRPRRKRRIRGAKVRPETVGIVRED